MHQLLKATRLRTLPAATEFLSFRSDKKVRAASENWSMVVTAYLSRWHFRILKANIWGQQARHVVAPTGYWCLRTELELFQRFHTERLGPYIYAYIHIITGSISLLLEQICYGMLTLTCRIQYLVPVKIAIINQYLLSLHV